MSRPLGGDPRPSRIGLGDVRHVLEYDPTDGLLVTARYLDGAVREAIEVRARLLEAALRGVLIAELERLGYTVTPPASTLDGCDADPEPPGSGS